MDNRTDPSTSHAPRAMSFNQAPFLVIWETTQACDLACVHCRANAQPLPLPGELSHEEGLALMDDVAAMGTPVLVLSGGDPLKRPDLLGLIRHGKSKSLRMATIPAATPRLTREVVVALHEAGLDQMALSLDASSAQAHDAFRGVAGAFQKTLDAIAWAHEAGLRVQLNTVMSQQNFEDVDALIDLVSRLGIVFWEVFFLVPTGRGSRVAGLFAWQYERVFTKLYALMQRASFVIKVTEAPQFRRFVIEQRMRASAIDPDEFQWDGRHLAQALGSIAGPQGTIGLAPQAVNAAKGFAFVSSQGEVFPSGFLPVSAGNIRQQSFAEVYREAPLFRLLRNPNKLAGRCGICEYRFLCGGSRSRAFAVTGDYLAEEPYCAYLPRAVRSRAGCRLDALSV